MFLFFQGFTAIGNDRFFNDHSKLVILFMLQGDKDVLIIHGFL